MKKMYFSLVACLGLYLFIGCGNMITNEWCNEECCICHYNVRPYNDEEYGY